MELNKDYRFLKENVSSIANGWADQLISCKKDKQLSKLILEFSEKTTSPDDVEQTMKKIMLIDYKKFESCWGIFYNTFPQYFNLDLINRVPESLEERISMVKLKLLEASMEARENRLHGSSEWALEKLFSSWKKLRLNELPVNDILILYQEIKSVCKELKISMPNKTFIKNLENLGLKEHLNEVESVSEFIKLIRQFSIQGGCTVEALFKKLDRFSLRKMIGHINKAESASEFIEHINQISSLGESAVQWLVENFDQFNFEKLTIKEKLELGKDLVSRKKDVAKDLSLKFAALGITDEFKALKDSSSFINFFEEIMSYGDWATLGLLEELSSWRSSDFNENFQEVLDVEQKLSLWKKMAGQGTSVSNLLMYSFSRFGFDGDLEQITDPSILMDVCEKMISCGEEMCVQLATHFYSYEKIMSELLSTEQKISLCDKLAAKGDRAFKSVLDLILWVFSERFSEMNFIDSSSLSLSALMEKTSIETMKKDVVGHEWLAVIYFPTITQSFGIQDRVELIELFVKQGPRAAEAFEKVLDEFPIDEIGQLESLPLRLELCRKLIFCADLAAEMIVEKFSALKLEELERKEKFSLCLEIIAQGPFAADSLIRNINFFDLNSEEILLIYQQVVARTPESLRSVNFDSIDEEEYRSSLLALFSLCAQQGSASELDSMLSFFESEIIRRQIFLEVSRSPEGIDKETFVFEDFPSIQSLEPLLPFLLKSDEVISEKEINELENFLSSKDELKPLLGIFQEAKKQEKEQVKRQLFKWIAYTAGVLNEGGDKTLLLKNDILKLISKYQSPQQRFLLTRQLGEVKEIYFDPSKKDSLKSKSVEEFSRLLLSRWIEGGLPKEQAKELYEKIVKKSGGFKDTKQSDALIRCLLDVILQTPLEKEEMVNIAAVIEKILDKNPKEAVIELQMLNAIMSVFGRREFLSCVSKYSSQTPAQFFQEKFQKILPVKIEGDFSEKYQNTFGNFRNLNALFTYLGSVNKLYGKEKRDVLNALILYAEGVLMKKDKFRSDRYETANHPHLKVIFESKEGLRESWLEGAKLQGLSVEESDVSTQNYKEILHQKMFDDEHLSAEDFPLLAEYIKGKLSFEEAKYKLVEDSDDHRFQLLAIQLCEGEIEGGQFVAQVKDLQCNLVEFKSTDLKQFDLKKGGKGECLIGETDDPEDLLLIGTEVAGSCQRVDGTPRLNKCLVGYLLNGEVRPIVVKQGGKIVARSMMRLLWDEKHKTPVLLQERHYANVQDSKLQQAIDQWAVKKAEKMGIPLISKDIIGKQQGPYDGQVMFLGGGRAPYIYTDAGGGVRNSSESFEFTDCHALYLPEKYTTL